jgi:hypothetical protein
MNEQNFNLVQSGTGTISVADADTMFSVKVNLPTAQISLCCIHHQEAIWQSLLLPGHPAIVFISVYYKLMMAHEQCFLELPIEDGPIAEHQCAVYQLQWMNLHANAFFRHQEISDVPVRFASNPREIITKAELQECWEPQLSDALFFTMASTT